MVFAHLRLIDSFTLHWPLGYTLRCTLVYKLVHIIDSNYHRWLVNFLYKIILKEIYPFHSNNKRSSNNQNKSISHIKQLSIKIKDLYFGERKKKVIQWNQCRGGQSSRKFHDLQRRSFPKLYRLHSARIRKCIPRRLPSPITPLGFRRNWIPKSQPKRTLWSTSLRLRLSFPSPADEFSVFSPRNCDLGLEWKWCIRRARMVLTLLSCVYLKATTKLTLTRKIIAEFEHLHFGQSIISLL